MGVCYHSGIFGNQLEQSGTNGNMYGKVTGTFVNIREGSGFFRNSVNIREQTLRFLNFLRNFCKFFTNLYVLPLFGKYTGTNGNVLEYSGKTGIFGYFFP